MVKLSVIEGHRDRARRFDNLIRPHYDMLYRTAYYWTRSVEDAEDLVQEACARAYPRLDDLEQLDRPASWLTQVMYRMFVDLTRRHDRRRVERLSEATMSSLPIDTPGPETDAERADVSAWLDSAWRRIDRRKRAMLALHDVEGYTLSELSEMTGLKESTIKSRLHRTRVALGRLLKQDAEFSHLLAAGGGKR